MEHFGFFLARDPRCIGKRFVVLSPKQIVSFDNAFKIVVNEVFNFHKTHVITVVIDTSHATKNFIGTQV